jgi:uncharacterized protein (TIGR01244 family)
MAIRMSIVFGVLACAIMSSHPAMAQKVTKADVPGVTNFARLETTVACAGATSPEAIPAIKQMGYKSIINMRLASEPNANVEGEAAAAKAAGINFIHLPFNGSSPDPAVADAFLKEVTKPENEPAFIHCASGNRVSAMWMIKRMVVDHWEADRAGSEAAELGLTNENLKKFALDYAASHKQ